MWRLALIGGVAGMVGLCCPARAQPPRALTAGAPPLAGTDLRDVEGALQTEIIDQLMRGRLDNRQARRLLRELGDIRRIDSFYRGGGDGAITAEQAADLRLRLDALRGTMASEFARGGGRSPPSGAVSERDH